MATQWNDKRPMAPHLQIWRWHPAMLSSILHRICSVVCYAALIKFSVGLLILKKTGQLPLEGLLYSPLGAIGMFVGVFSAVFVALAQLRHLVWDQGKFFDPEANNKMSWLMIFASVAVAAIFVAGIALKGGA